jgi:hypothetical protein
MKDLPFCRIVHYDAGIVIKVEAPPELLRVGRSRTGDDIAASREGKVTSGTPRREAAAKACPELRRSGAPPALDSGVFWLERAHARKLRNEMLVNPLKTHNSAKSLIQQPQ